MVAKTLDPKDKPASEELIKMNSIENMDLESYSCGCIGPQNGEPLCPCQMRGVKIQNGRYVKTIDYGPIPGSITYGC